MLTKPEKILFESPSDIVDYVSKGMVPSGKNFERVMLKVRMPDDNNHEPDLKEVYIPERAMINCDSHTMEMALRRVYENRVRNRNITLALIGTAAITLLLGSMGSKKNDKHNEEDTIEYIVMDMDPLD